MPREYADWRVISSRAMRVISKTCAIPIQEVAIHQNVSLPTSPSVSFSYNSFTISHHTKWQTTLISLFSVMTHSSDSSFWQNTGRRNAQE